MSRLQLALNVDDLEQSIAFYSTLFGTEPAKVKPGYANFAVAEPPLKLVLIEAPGLGGSINHLGVEVPDVDAVDAELTRLGEAGFASVEEHGTTCCYAKQDKFWVQDTPNGEQWEVYTVLADSDVFGDDYLREPTSGCCTSDGDAGAGAEPAPSASACC
jgi:catechol 2,3-dioxygenase-like lactoylglutathione lyase family enzyme